MTRSLFSFAALPQGAFFGAENEFWPYLLKDSFNLGDSSAHGVDPVFIRGERMENIAL